MQREMAHCYLPGTPLSLEHKMNEFSCPPPPPVWHHLLFETTTSCLKSPPLVLVMGNWHQLPVWTTMMATAAAVNTTDTEDGDDTTPQMQMTVTTPAVTAAASMNSDDSCSCSCVQNTTDTEDGDDISCQCKRGWHWWLPWTRRVGVQGALANIVLFILFTADYTHGTNRTMHRPTNFSHYHLQEAETPKGAQMLLVFGVSAPCILFQCCIRPTHTQLPTQVCKPVTSANHLLFDPSLAWTQDRGVEHDAGIPDFPLLFYAMRHAIVSSLLRKYIIYV